MSNEVKHEKSAIRFEKRWLLIIALFLIVAFLAYAWSQRIIIAERAIEDQLDEYGIEAKYEIIEIGPRFQKLRNVVIGDPDNPDFTAKEVDIDVKINFAGAVLKTIWVRGGSLNGTYKSGKLSFGALDKFTDNESDEAPELPDIALDIADSRLRLDTDWGRIGVGLVGRGHLQSSFNGHLAAQMNTLNIANCRSDMIVFKGMVKISNKQPNIKGQLNNLFTACTGVGTVKQVSINTDINLSQHFDRWRGETNINIASAQNSEARLNNIKADIDFVGNIERTDAQYSLKEAALFTEVANIANIKADGEGRISISDNAYNYGSFGQVSFTGGRLDDANLSDMRALGSIADNSPLSPLLRIFAPEVANTLANFSGEMQYDIAFGDTVNDQNTIILDNIRFASRSGGKMVISNNLRFSKNIASSSSTWRLNSPIGLSVGGGKLPKLTAKLKQNIGNRWSGEVEMPAYKTDNSLLALKALRFANNRQGGWDFNGNALISGPIPSGRIDALSLPIDGSWSLSGGVKLYDSCQNISFGALQASTLRLEGQTLQICPSGDRAVVQSTRDGDLIISARTDNVKLAGLLGNSVINMQSSELQFNLADGLDAANVNITIGENEGATLFEMDQLTANFAGPSISGQAINGRGKIGTVPLGAENAQLNWEFADNILSVNGDLMIFDREQEDRFNPLKMPDLLLTLENGEIAALGQVQEPQTGRKLADIDVKHRLDDAKGRALFSVDNLMFNDQLQPEMITNIALGVVANVQGAIDGDGQIKWQGDEVTSTGKFGTQDLDLAAAFGPVNGLSGEIQFTDLINFESEDRQIINLESVNPGVAVLDGRISYQLLPGQKVEVHGGSWPFAGGRLILEPTIWDFAENVERKMAFEVTGMDSAIFLEQFEFASLSTTGIFDGRLPMVFNAEGGRIVDGSLVSTSGGNFSYIDELATEDLSAFGNYAFDTLKSIDYETMTVEMDGNIEGEIVTGVRLTGLKQGAGANKNFITKQLAKIPLEFNVKIEASFLNLLYLVEGAGDPEATIRRFRPDLLTGYTIVNNEQVVQPVESKDSP